MATNKYQVVEVLSDISGESGATTTTYAINGQAYSIDLTETESKEFRDLMSPYISVSAIGKNRGVRQRSTPEETALIKEWALEQGLPLTPKGRVPATTRLAYAEAMDAEAEPKKKRAPKAEVSAEA